MFCPNCGANVPDNGTFCPNCGTSFPAKDSAQQAEQQPYQQPYQQQQQTYQQQAYQQPAYQQPAYQQPAYQQEPYQQQPYQQPYQGETELEKSIFITGLLAIILACCTTIGGIICGAINRSKVGQAKRAGIPLIGKSKVGNILGLIGLILGFVLTALSFFCAIFFYLYLISHFGGAFFYY